MIEGISTASMSYDVPKHAADVALNENGVASPSSTANSVPREEDTITLHQDNEEQQQVAELKQRDREVRAHEAAHVAAGGQFVRGGANFSYQTGPDGKKYAVGGEVSIDTSKVSGDPEATIRKMQVVRKAALAPANPSAQDRAVAAQASQVQAQAHQDLKKEHSERLGDGETSETTALQEESSPHKAGYTDRGEAREQTQSSMTGQLIDILS